MYSIEGVLNVVTEVFDEPIITLGECIAFLQNSDLSELKLIEVAQLHALPHVSLLPMPLLSTALS